MTEIARNIAQVRERIARAAARVGRPAESVTLLAVSKKVELARIADAYAVGQRDFGESYVQEALAKIEQTRQTMPDIRWHLIGHLQSKKARSVIEPFALLQSVDSLPLAREIGKRAQQAQRTADILLEVKLDTGSETRFGVLPDAVTVTARQIEAIAGVRLRGLMGIAPYDPNPEQARPYFRALRTLFEELSPAAQQILSMGMSGDFEVAVEEGSTMVRIGSALFGTRA